MKNSFRSNEPSPSYKRTAMLYWKLNRPGVRKNKTARNHHTTPKTRFDYDNPI